LYIYSVWNVLVNGVDQGVGNKAGGYIDSPPNNSPVTNVASKDMECNVANVKASKSISANAGDEIAFQWYHDTNSASDDIIADVRTLSPSPHNFSLTYPQSHKGPIMVYASKAGSSLSWTKLWEDTFDGQKWAVDKLLAGSYTGKKGQHSMKIPALAAGDYIFRPEIIGLHEGNRQGGAQFYMECVHVKIGGSGSKTLPAGVSFPGAYKATDAGVLFDIYAGKTSYPGVGPKGKLLSPPISYPSSPITYLHPQ
jgi:cellulase